ncbi:MAG: hypothetical protein P8X64_03025 [Anaerolineales bacterium]|jgi:preprotein translocase subunit SecG
MAKQNPFKEVEQRTIQLINFEDGLWDLMLGVIFMALAVYPLTRQWLGPEWNLLLFVVLLGLVVFVQQMLRRRLSSPRIGRVVPRRTPKLRLVLAVLVLMVAATLVLVLVTLLQPAGSGGTFEARGGGARSYIMEYVVLLALVVLFSLMGYLFNVARLYLYGWLLGLGNLGSVVLEHQAGWTFNLPLAIAAGIIMAIGVVLLADFLKRYPLHQGAG